MGSKTAAKHTQKSEQGLANVIRSLQKVFRLLQQKPEIGRYARRNGIRFVVEPDYRYIIYYTVQGEQIWILRVYHSRRQPLDLLTLKSPGD